VRCASRPSALLEGGGEHIRLRDARIARHGANEGGRMSELILIKGAEVYAPERLGRRDVFIGGGRVLAVEESIEAPAGWAVEEVPADGLRLVPSLIDGHVHIAGAGGEGGPTTRTPELRLSQLVDGGVTTVVGCLGTDGVTRSLRDLLMKAKALRGEGVSCWILTGAYQVPTPTITGEVPSDLALIEEVIGVGEIAVADHRSSVPTAHELARLAAQTRVGAMLGGKAGIVNLHMGDAEDPFRIVHEAVGMSELSYGQFLPTHCNRNAWIFDDAKSYGLDGVVDLTASSWPYFCDEEIKPSKAVVELLAAGVPLDHITVSSDACGSLPEFDEHGELVRLAVGEPSCLLRELADLVRTEGLSLDQAVAPFTSSVAAVFKLPGKGRVELGADADLLLLDDDFSARHLLARGRFLMRDGAPLAKGTFES
jgi:beta-aspartyl-dipeptidase (metallo-type)